MPKAVQLMLEEELAQKYETLSSEEKKKIHGDDTGSAEAKSLWTSLRDILNRLAQGEAKKQTGQPTGHRPSYFGSAKGKIKISKDFDKLLDDFKNYQ